MAPRGSSFTTAPQPNALTTAVAVKKNQEGVDAANRGGETSTVVAFPGPDGRTVLGPSGAVDGNVAIFDGTSGTLIADSGVSINDLGYPKALGYLGW